MKSARTTSHPSTVIAAALLVVGIASPAPAQDTQGAPPEVAPPETEMESLRPSAQQTAHKDALLLKGSVVLGETLVDAEGQPSGIARDLALADDGGILAVLIASLEGEGLVPVPLEALEAVTAAHHTDTEAAPQPCELEGLRLRTASRSQLSSAPRCSLSTPIDRALLTASYEHFGADPTRLGMLHDKDAPSRSEAAGEMDSDTPEGESDAEADEGVVSASTRGEPASRLQDVDERGLIVAHFPAALATEVSNRPVVGPEGDELGHIADLALRFDRAEVAYAVLSVDGEKRFAVPYTGLVQAGLARPLTLDVDPERLDQAAGFDSWPETADETLFPTARFSRAGTPARAKAAQGTSGG